MFFFLLLLMFFSTAINVFFSYKMWIWSSVILKSNWNACWYISYLFLANCWSGSKFTKKCLCSLVMLPQNDRLGFKLIPWLIGSNRSGVRIVVLLFEKLYALRQKTAIACARVVTKTVIACARAVTRQGYISCSRSCYNFGIIKNAYFAFNVL